MAKPKFNDQGFISVMKSKKTVDLVTDITNSIAAAGGKGMRAKVKMGPTRVRGTVTTATLSARRAEAKSQKLTRAIDSGRRR